MDKGSVLTANSSPFVFGANSSPNLASHPPKTQQHPSLTATRTSSVAEKVRPQRPASPLFSISTDFDSEQSKETNGELTSKSTLAAGIPSTRTFSPSPLLWGEGGWDAGHFSFGGGAGMHKVDESKHPFSDGSGGSEGGGGTAVSSGNSLPESADSGYGSTVGGGDSLVVDSVPKDADTTPRLSALVPTAAPFVFHPKAPTGVTSPPSSSLRLNFRHSPAPVPTHLPLPTPPLFTSASSAGYSTPPCPFPHPYTPPSAPHVELSPAPASTSGGWTFDSQGHLVAGQGEAKYTIADEILQLQSTPVAKGGRDVAFASNGIDETRMKQVQHQRSLDGWQFQAQRQYPPTPPSSTPSDLRSRSSSLASVTSYFSSPSQPAAERSPTAAQLQSYFGPTPNASIDVSDAFLHHPLSALQTDPEDLLYTLARQTFVAQSLSLSSAAPATPAQRLAMNTHFDRAMHSPNPLATLYGLSQEQANRLAEEPGTSGVSECVLQLAKTRATLFAGGGREGGPSPNNRKLGLYKTELCRSWEEKGSCRYGTRCQFAHGTQEVRSVARHPKFKSEVCRTFWLHGSCPYGRRCCFIHTTVAGGLPTGPPPDSLTHSLNALSSMSMESVPDNPPRQISRLARLSSSSLATPTQPGSFGPALNNYLGPNGSTASSSTTAAYSNASAYSNERFRGDPNDGLFDQGLGTGIKSAGRFTHNPSEVPATYQDPPQSRLRRLAAQGSAQSTFGVGSSYPSEPAYIATSAPASRHQSNQSNDSNVSSSTASSYPGFSPFIPRVNSTSSVSSYGGASAYEGVCPLQPASNDWLGGSSSSSGGKNGPLDWSSNTEDDEGGAAGRLFERNFGGLSLAIDRSTERTPRGQHVV